MFHNRLTNKKQVNDAEGIECKDIVNEGKGKSSGPISNTVQQSNGLKVC
jgi:hypothetical protein